MFPLRAEETFDLEYNLENAKCEGVKVIVRVTTQWPEHPHINHVANSPQVHLDPSNDDHVAFIDLKQVENDATLTGKHFSATQKGRSVLHFKRNYIENTLPKEISLKFDGNAYADTETIALGSYFP